MTTVELVQIARTRFERVFAALVDPVRSERTVVLLLGAYVVTWTLYAAIAKSSQDIHPDMGEMVAWSREAGMGTPKHPPLAAWLVRAWFDAFPREDWAYYLLALIMPAIALWITWRISARYLPRDKCVVGIALLTLVPFYNLLALKFNANTVLMPLWAATIWWFLRSLETRYAGWAVLAGIGAAAAMLGKYWSIVLLAALGLTALIHPRRSAYFSSLAPLLTLATGMILLTPHIDWLIANQFMTFSYATEMHSGTTAAAARSAVGFIGGSLGYIALPILFFLLAARPGMAAIGDTVWPREPERRILVIAFVAPFLFAILVALLLQVRIDPLWAISAMTLFPVVMLSSPLVTIPRPAAVLAVAGAIVIPLVMVAVSPVIAAVIHREGVTNHASHYRLLAAAVENSWHAHSDKPLRIVGGSDNIVNGMAFYFVHQPATFDLFSPGDTPWIDDESIRRDGMAMVCPYSEVPCGKMFDGYVAHYHVTAIDRVTLARRYLGTEDAPVEYQIGIIPPAGH